MKKNKKIDSPMEYETEGRSFLSLFVSIMALTISLVLLVSSLLAR